MSSERSDADASVGSSGGKRLRTGLVLAGGGSRRFGRRDKALAELGETPLLVRVVERVAAAVGEVLVSCHPTQIDPFEKRLDGSPADGLVVDESPGAGPLAGVAAGCEAASGTYVAVVACDMPFVKPGFLTALFERARARNVDAVVPEQSDGRLQPLQAVYRTERAREVAAEMLPEERSVRRALEALTVTTVSSGSVPDWAFHNVNTPADLRIARQYRDG